MRDAGAVAVSCRLDEDQARAVCEVLGAGSVAFLRRLPAAERPGALRLAAAVIGWNPQRELPAGALVGAPALRLVQLLSAGADGVDFGALPPGVAVAGNVGAYAKPIAEHVLAMTLALARRLPQRHAALAAGDFNQRDRLATLDGAVCSILGLGGIGAATARLMRAFGARVHAVNTSGRTDEQVEFVGTLADLDRVLAAANVLVISLPLTTATRGLIGARELALMRPDAIMVNVARAAIVDERALHAHLARHPEFGAGIDAWWHEPRRGAGFRTGFPFLDLPNVIGSPHNSAIVPGALASATRRAAENVRAFLRGDPPAGLILPADYL